MTLKIAINGFGRIGRLVARALHEYDIRDVELVLINSPGKIETSAHLLRYDSVHGRFDATVEEGPDWIDFGRGRIAMTHERDPADVSWDQADLVMECTGLFRSRERCQPHFDGGAKAVLISAPGEDVDRTIVYGVNHDLLGPDDRLVSCASCTTNCLAPIAKVIMDTAGIRRGFMTTVHAYTQDQRILDNSHKDLYRARAAGLNMIPTSTGAAKAVGKVIPELDGRLSGSAVRVPTANVSMVDLAFQPEESITAEALNAAMLEAAEGPMRGIISYTTEPLVSSDLNHDPHSATFASPLTKSMDGNLLKVVAWYDNEWGFANRMIDVARTMGERLDLA
ncbi:type I glyceraldehyde-3-phosphate dehydrogenase [uncultured Algimonas sp.]|uniref:type I glyceraldehyde-3-phosphate dehydrogenase n=1 Tax=uncultured Algimonas sp. TaxID=1547920 RepID=UPI0026342A1E|nr:type I glyceraldehyde-3-phosphate dehydrogenase [uncultured Algimonas sp.]